MSKLTLERKQRAHHTTPDQAHMSHRIQSTEDTKSSSNNGEEEDQGDLENGIASNEQVETKNLGERFASFSQLYIPTSDKDA